MASNKSVIVAGTGVRIEKVALAAITPGMLVEQDSANKFKVHATADGEAQPIFALEDSLRGNDIDDAYVAANQCVCVYASPGMLINALLANGESVAIGDRLNSNGDGYLKKYVAYTTDSDDESVVKQPVVVAIAQEALDMSSSSSVDPASQRLLVETV